MRRLFSLAVLALALSSPAQQKHSKPAAPSSKPAQDVQLYRNTLFGFRYRVPYGWVERTKDLQEGNDAGKGEVLLAIFERPPQAAGDTVNSAVVIAAESAASYPGLKSAVDYLGPLTELTTAKGFKPTGDPEEMTIDARILVRADFSKVLNDKLTMYQSTIVLVGKGKIVSFTFLGGSGDEVDDLIERLNFGLAKPGAR